MGWHSHTTERKQVSAKNSISGETALQKWKMDIDLTEWTKAERFYLPTDLPYKKLYTNKHHKNKIIV